MAHSVLSRVIYGTTRSEQLLAKKLKIRPAILHGYCRHQVKYVDYPGIIPEHGKSVKGTYVTDLTREDIRRLDTFEGEEYTRDMVTVKLLDDDGTEEVEAVECSTYVYMDPKNLVREEWDFNRFVSEKLRYWVGDSKEYDEVDAMDPMGGRWWADSFKEQQKPST